MTTATESVSSLIAEFRSASATERPGILRAIGKLGVSAVSALPTLSQAVNDQNPKIREAAAHAISELGLPALSTMVRLLAHSDKYVRRHAVWGLGKLGSKAKPVLVELARALRDEDPRTASGAAQAIGNMAADGAPAINALAEAMRGTNIVLCRLASKALSQIGLPALPTLIAHLKNHDPFVRGEAAVALGWMGAEAAGAVQPLIEIVRATRSRKLPSGAKSAMSQITPATPLAAAVPMPDPQTEEIARINAIVALGRIGPDAITALPYLQDAMEDSSELIRRAADLAIRQVQGVG